MSNVKDEKVAMAMNIIKDIVKTGCNDGDQESVSIMQVLLYEESEYLETGDLNKMTTYRSFVEYLKDVFTEAYDKFEEAKPGWGKKEEKKDE